MATLEDEVKELKEQNNELAQKVQYWKMTAAERNNEKLDLMKEINELRLKLSRLRNTGGFEARKLDASLQQASEKAISHLVKASSEIAKGMEIAKAYIRDREQIDNVSPRWSAISGTPTTDKTDKVHRVPPMMMGGHSIQPVVSLSRTLLNSSNPSSRPRVPSQNRSTTERAVPMHMLQDVYIPLTRIDISDLPNNNIETDAEVDNVEPNEEDDEEDMGLNDSEEALEESAQLSEVDEEYSGRKLHTLSEEDSEMEDIEPPRLSLRLDNPLEGPSWLLDSPPDSRSSNTKSGVGNLEPDSTTELDRKSNNLYTNSDDAQKESANMSLRLSCEFSPTVRRRKRVSSPPGVTTPRQHHYSPRPSAARRSSTSGRVLKVVLAKMQLDGEGQGATSPAKRARSPCAVLAFDAPSPNGATDARVIVSETRTSLDIKTEPGTSNRRDSNDFFQRSRLNSQDGHRNRSTLDSQNISEDHENIRKRLNTQDRSRLLSHDSRLGSHDSRDSDSGSGGGGDSISEGRTRRPRKQITYKEKPLNRKLRR